MLGQQFEITLEKFAHDFFKCLTQINPKIIQFSHINRTLNIVNTDLLNLTVIFNLKSIG